MDLEVMFHPDQKTQYEESILVKVNGGPDRFIRCFAKLGKAIVNSNPKALDFDVIAVGLSKQQVSKLKYDLCFYL